MINFLFIETWRFLIQKDSLDRNNKPANSSFFVVLYFLGCYKLSVLLIFLDQALPNNPIYFVGSFLIWESCKALSPKITPRYSWRKQFGSYKNLPCIRSHIINSVSNFNIAPRFSRRPKPFWIQHIANAFVILS